MMVFLSLPENHPILNGLVQRVPIIDERRKKYVFPLFNLRYEAEQKTVEVKLKKAGEPDVKFLPQEKKTTEIDTFSETGKIKLEIEHPDFYEIEDAVKLIRLFLREKDNGIAKDWPKARIKKLIVEKLKADGYDENFLSKVNLIRLQQGFGPMFRELGKEHPRLSQTAKDIELVELAKIQRQSFSESSLKEHGAVWYVKDEPAPFVGQEVALWEQYQKWKQIAGIDQSGLTEDAREIAKRIQQVDLSVFKTPWNVHYASYEPERMFSDWLFQNADLFDAFVKMPNQGGYSFPYSYKPAKAGKTHVANENFNPDFFIRVRAKNEVLVVEVKSDDDDSKKNEAKCRDGLKHFETLNEKLDKIGEPWRYYFYFLSPEDFASFFERIRADKYSGWKSGLMQQLTP